VSGGGLKLKVVAEMVKGKRILLLWEGSSYRQRGVGGDGVMRQADHSLAAMWLGCTGGSHWVA
jgi:hypothetical protein